VTVFYLDMRLQEFRQVDNLFNTIEFVEFQENEKGLSIQFDMNKRTAFHGTQEEKRERKDLVKMIQLPPLWKMDPVGWIEYARDAGRAISQNLKSPGR
jgi:hypothetical protein